MGVVKEWLLEQAAKEREEEFREWKRSHPKGDWSDFELDEAFQHAMDKDD